LQTAGGEHSQPYGALELDAWLLSDAGHFLPSHELREAYNDRHKALHALLASDPRAWSWPMAASIR
jgi:hypothetical protein